MDRLLADADDDGLAPLLRAHLRAAGVTPSTRAADHLHHRWMQHSHAGAMQTRILAQVLAAMQDAGIPVLVLKGAALAQTVYPDPVLRPMRDIDLLVRAEDLARAAGLFRQRGFAVTGPPVPADHHHTRALSTTAAGVMVTIELHHALLQPTPFLRPIAYADVVQRAQPFELSSRTYHTLGCEDMLWHVYAHAFAINVTRPAPRLISVADLTVLTDQWIDRIDWAALASRYGRAARALPLLHHLTPWSSDVLARTQWNVDDNTADVRRIAPRLALSGDAWRDVLWPPDWWLRVRYGVKDPLHKLRCRAWTHPANLAASAVRSARMRIPGS